MGSRRPYIVDDLERERERGVRGSGHRGQRDYGGHEFDFGRPRSEYDMHQPDFLREDYGRTTAGPLVVADRYPPEDDWVPPPSSSRRDGDRRAHGRPDRGDGDPRRSEPLLSNPRYVEHDDYSPPPPRARRETKRNDIVFRRGEGPRGQPAEPERDSKSGHNEERMPRRVSRERVRIRRTESEGPPLHRSRSHKGDLIARETEELVIRRRQSRPPSPPPSHERQQEVIIRRTERSSSPAVSPPPVPHSAPPDPIVRPPIVQEIITHHRHIDHGIERARSLTPPPPPLPPSPPRDEKLEISIRNRRPGRDRKVIFEREARAQRPPAEDVQEPRRRRSVSLPRKKCVDDGDMDEAEFYNRKAMERAYHGEAYNGATKDWSVVDVPPGTNRVRMEGIGGGAQEVSWQAYNGARRSKFIANNEESATEWAAPVAAPPPLSAPPTTTSAPVWTEITKDLVEGEAIKSMGYDYEETTDEYYHVMGYLCYEEVLQLVEASDEIRRSRRRRRIREIEIERRRLEPSPPPPRLPPDHYEREIVYEAKTSHSRHR